MTPIRPDPILVDKLSEPSRQRIFANLRARQRAAQPIIAILRELGDIAEGAGVAGEIRIKFVDREAVEISVVHVPLNQYLLKKYSQEGQE